MQLPQRQAEPISIEEFLPILIASEVKLELLDGNIVPFANGTVAHAEVCDRIVSALRRAAKPGCRVLASDVALQHKDAPTYVFPDVQCTCEPVDAEADSIVAPGLIVEVMSPRSVERDRVDKLDSYQSIPSVREYLIVDSTRRWACAYSRSSGTWIQTIYGPDDTIELRSAGGVQLKMADIYAGIV
jgi:Uma2 family endonuclease